MIKSFRHKGLERFFITGSTRGLDARLTAKLGRLLATLHTAETPEDMRAPRIGCTNFTGTGKGNGLCG